MSDYYARSPRPQHGQKAQSYADHISGVLARANNYISDLLEQDLPYGGWLKSCVSRAAIYHDLGKLDDRNQKVLSGLEKSPHLPLRHEDAGAAHCAKLKDWWAAMLIYAHHQGLPNRSDEEIKGAALFLRIAKLAEHTNTYLPLYLQRHEEAGMAEPPLAPGDDSFKAYLKNHMPLRIALSCLVDADHTDAASAGGSDNLDCYPRLRAKERLASLDAFVKKLATEAPPGERRDLRQQMYELCRQSSTSGNISYCDIPVGTGKTTAVMAYLLQQAIDRKLRRIFVVLPYTNIIDQAVNVYRQALTLAGEDPQAVVAAHHSRADFENEALRDMTTTWRAPIVITSAVQFFETMAAARPASLRKLHRLPRSAIFLDEAHAALPIALWPLAWNWLKEYAQTLGCHFVLGSGSLYKFWELPKIETDKNFNVPPLLPISFTKKMNAHEDSRVTYHYHPHPLTIDSIAPWLNALPGPRLCIVNTVQSAAFIADKIRKENGRDSVEHLSTALTPKDRTAVLKKIRRRLKDTADDNWTLVGTSCVEAGVDLSFKCGIRQISSLVSLMQTAGRINRHNEYGSGQMWSIDLTGPYMNAHPAFKFSSQILIDFIKQGKIKPEFCTQSLQLELDESNIPLCSKNNDRFAFQDIANSFKVINSDTRTVIVDGDIIESLKNYEHVPWRTLQENSIQIWADKIDKLRLKPVLPGASGDTLYAWPYDYDNCLGYMKGVMPIIELETSTVAIL